MVFFPKSAILALVALCSAAKVEASWNTLTETLPHPVSDMTATLIPSEKNTDDDLIYIAGGCSSEKGNEKMGENFYGCAEVTNEMYAFNVKTKTFTKMKDMPEPRYRHAAVEIYGKLYVVGGRNVIDDIVPTIIAYDPATDNWSDVRVLPDQYKVSDNAALTYEGKLYVLGGYDATYTAMGFLIEVDPETQGITRKDDMITPRGDANAVSYQFADGKTSAYIMGGFTHANDFCAPLADAEKYDFINDEWSIISDMNFERGDKSVVVQDGRILAIGGERKAEGKCSLDYVTPQGEEGSGSILVDHVEYYDPREEEPIWKFEEAFAEHRFRGAAVAVESTNSVYVFGGQALYATTCECYPTSNTIFEYNGGDVVGVLDISNSSDDNGETSAAMKSAMYGSIFVSLLSSLSIIGTA